MSVRVKQAVSNLKTKKIAGSVTVYIIMGLLVAFTALPLVYLVCTAFKPLNELYVFPPQFFVRNPTLKNFNDLVLSLSSSSVPYTRYAFNSLFMSACVTAGTIFLSTLGAYGTVKHHPPGSKAMFQLIVASLMFSPYVTQIPRYLVINQLNLVDSYAAIILPGIVSSYNFFLIKQFVEQLPNDLIEAARIDGAGEYLIYWKIILPMLTPAWSTLMVFSFVGIWNDFFSPLIYLTDPAKQPLTLALNTISGGGLGRAGAVAASAMLMTIPTVVVFSFAQKKVMQTMIYSGIKG